MLSVHKLCKSRTNKSILQSITFEAPKGTIACFLGSSGAGKTTLLRILNGLETYDSGSFLLDERTPSRHDVGMVFQHFNLFEHLSVKQNITLPQVLKGISKQKAAITADLLLEKYGLFDKAQTSVGRLSGGQKQRLAIARTISTRPQIICLDEPTSALDPVLTSQVADYIQDLAKQNCIVLLTTHDMGLLEHLKCKLYFMKDGTIAEMAESSDFRKSPQNYPFLSKYFI